MVNHPHRSKHQKQQPTHTPELLAALKSAEWALDVLNDWFKKNNSDQNSRIAINTRNQARAIIDKVEGR